MRIQEQRKEDLMKIEIKIELILIAFICAVLIYNNSKCFAIFLRSGCYFRPGKLFPTPGLRSSMFTMCNTQPGQF